MTASVEPEDGVPAWYGKIASLGDFASRRMPSELVTRFDDWMQQIMAGSRSALGDAWLDTYLTSPIWRFVLFPGAVDEDAWAGLVMPSCDKVGRYFPLCIAALVPHGEPDARLLASLDAWLERIEAIALGTLHAGSSLQDFDDSLAQIRLELSVDSGRMRPVAKGMIEGLRSGGIARLNAPEVGAMGAAVAFAGATLFSEIAHGAGLWWCAAQADQPMRIFITRGLPEVPQYVAMLCGA
jgi:type VI secretion system protein ImpM